MVGQIKVADVCGVPASHLCNVASEKINNCVLDVLYNALEARDLWEKRVGWWFHSTAAQ